jgi:hypothetical protein
MRTEKTPLTLKRRNEMNKESSNLISKHNEIVELFKKYKNGKLPKVLEKVAKEYSDKTIPEEFSGVLFFVNSETGNKRVYTGETKHGFPHGRGIDDFVDEGFSFEGEFRNGKPNGQSTITWSDGSMYEGQVIDGEKSGSGTYTHPDGMSDDGEWLNDKPIRIKRYENGKIIGKHYFLKNGGSSSIDDKFLTISEYKKKNPKNKSLNN